MSLASASDLTPTVRELAHELIALLADLDPARWRDHLSPTARARLDRVAGQLAELRALAPATDAFAALRARLGDLAAALDEHAPATDAGRDAWMRLRARLLVAYDALARALRDLEVHVPALRPTNYRRNLFHISFALFALLLLEVLLTQPLLVRFAAGFFVWSWGCELLRRRVPAVNRALMRVLGPFAHPHEHWRINSATWYATAILLLTLTGDPELQVCGVAILGFADPAAAVVGRRYGRHKIIHGRSLEGTLAFIVVGALVALLLLAGPHRLALPHAALVALAAALPAALAELLSRRVDDNLSIPLSAAAGAWLALTLLGLR